MLRALRSWARLLAVVTLAGPALSGCAGGAPAERATAPVEGRADVPAAPARQPKLERCPAAPAGAAAVAGLPRMTLPCLGPGPAVELGLRRDRPQLMNVWASWCIPCQKEMPRMQAAHAAAGDRVLFLGVDSWDTHSSALDFLAAVGVTYPQVFDEEGRYLRGLGVPGLPVTVLVDAGGHIVYKHAGEMSAQQLQEALAKVGVRIALPEGRQ